MSTKLTVIIISYKLVSQIILLYTLNLYNTVFQLYLHKTGRKKLQPSTQTQSFSQT